MRKHGFSLIETLIFVSILSLLFVVTASVTTLSIRNMKISQHKVMATHYADELMEWLIYQKQSSWQTISEKAPQIGETYCFSTLDWDHVGACTTETVGTIYKRQATLTANNSPATSINIEILVQWNEPGPTSYSVNQKSFFSVYE